MSRVRLPASANANARFDARNDLPSLRPGLVTVTTVGPVPWAWRTFRRIPRTASTTCITPSGFRLPPLRLRCGTAPRIGSPIAPVTCCGYRTRRSVRSRTAAPATPAPRLERNASAMSTGRQFSVGSSGWTAGSTSRTSGMALTSARRASSYSVCRLASACSPRVTSRSSRVSSTARGGMRRKLLAAESTRCPSSASRTSISRVRPAARPGIVRRSRSCTSTATRRTAGLASA